MLPVATWDWWWLRNHFLCMMGKWEMGKFTVGVCTDCVCVFVCENTILLHVQAKELS